MFSALRKLATNSKNEPSSTGRSSTNGGAQAMAASLQKKFAKGVHYNSNFLFNYIVFDPL